MLYTISEDLNGEPMYPSEEKKNSHDAEMADYLDKLGVKWPFVADVGFQLEPFFAEAGLPLTLIVDTSDMRLRYVRVGHYPQIAKASIWSLLAE